MENIKYFKDLPKEEQQEFLEKLHNGERVYGLSKDDDTHIKFAVMVALSSLGSLFEDDPILTMLEIGIDEQGLFVSYPYNQDLEDAISQIEQ